MPLKPSRSANLIKAGHGSISPIERLGMAAEMYSKGFQALQSTAQGMMTNPRTFHDVSGSLVAGSVGLPADLMALGATVGYNAYLHGSRWPDWEMPAFKDIPATSDWIADQMGISPESGIYMVASSLSPSGAVGAAAVGGTKLAMMGGALARMAPLTVIDKADGMRRAGRSVIDIQKETGMIWSEPSQKWMHWISDDNFKIPDLETFVKSHGRTMDQVPIGGWGILNMRLSEFVDHEQLFANYPMLRDYEFQIGIKKVENSKGEISYILDNPSVLGARGQLREASTTRVGSIKIGNPEFDEVGTPRAYKALRRTLLHEIQHTIQQIEGMARGGSPDWVEKQLTLAQDSRRTAKTTHDLSQRVQRNGKFGTVEEIVLRRMYSDMYKGANFQRNMSPEEISNLVEQGVAKHKRALQGLLSDDVLEQEDAIDFLDNLALGIEAVGATAQRNGDRFVAKFLQEDFTLFAPNLTRKEWIENNLGISDIRRIARHIYDHSEGEWVARATAELSEVSSQKIDEMLETMTWDEILAKYGDPAPDFGDTGYYGLTDTKRLENVFPGNAAGEFGQQDARKGVKRPNKILDSERNVQANIPGLGAALPPLEPVTIRIKEATRSKFGIEEDAWSKLTPEEQRELAAIAVREDPSLAARIPVEKGEAIQDAKIQREIDPKYKKYISSEIPGTNLITKADLEGDAYLSTRTKFWMNEGESLEEASKMANDDIRRVQENMEATEKYKKGVNKVRIENRLHGAGKPKWIDILKNPTETELRRWAKMNLVEEDGFSAVRVLTDVQNNLYVWDANLALHSDVIQTTGMKINIFDDWTDVDGLEPEQFNQIFKAKKDLNLVAQPPDTNLAPKPAAMQELEEIEERLLDFDMKGGDVYDDLIEQGEIEEELIQLFRDNPDLPDQMWERYKLSYTYKKTPEGEFLSTPDGTEIMVRK